MWRWLSVLVRNNVFDILMDSLTENIWIGSGIGLETALTFAERGSRAVVFADQALDAALAASEKSKSIATAKDYQTIAIMVDVRDRTSVKAMAAEIKEQFGRLDYAVNSAGVS